MTDDVKALAERLARKIESDVKPFSRREDCGWYPQNLRIVEADLLVTILRSYADRLAPQREDVIDREAIARIIDPKAFIIANSKRFEIQEAKAAALDKADAIRSLAAQPRSNSVEDK